MLTHVSSTQVTPRAGCGSAAAAAGSSIEKTTDGLALSGSTIERTQTGVSIGGQNVELRDVLIGDSQSGVRIERGAGGVTATALNVTGGQDGVVVVPGTDGRGAARPGDRRRRRTTGCGPPSPNAQILGGRISGSTTGIDAEAATTINGTEITG